MAGKRIASAMLGVVGLLVWMLSGCGDTASSPRNLLLLTVDTLRADHLAVYGYPHDTSPTLDRLAADGVLFRNAIVQRGGTWPSLTSLLTSMYPRTHGVRSNGDMLAPRFRTLAERLQRHGFRTQAMLTNMLQAKHRGFDEVLLFGDEAPGGRDSAATNHAIQWLRSAPEGRFFLWLHLMGPHDPYAPAPEFQQRFGTGYDGPLNGERELLQEIHAERRTLSAGDVAHIVSLYDADIAEVDAKIERILRALRDSGLVDDTLVIFASDHGEELYDHNRYFLHSWSIYDSVLRVPLILSAPSWLPTGASVDGVVESIDVAPTIFELLGLPIPDVFEGTSLVAGIANDEGAPAAGRTAFSELGPYIQSARTDRWHYIYNPRRLTSPGARGDDSGRGGLFRIEREELYDVLGDPGQRRNVVRDHPEVAAELRGRVLRWNGSAADPYRAQELTPKVREELRALGYVD